MSSVASETMINFMHLERDSLDLCIEDVMEFYIAVLLVLHAKHLASDKPTFDQSFLHSKDERNEELVSV